MKKLLGLLSAMTLLIAPTSSLVACGHAPSHTSSDDTDPAAVLAQLRSQIYSELVKQYQAKVGSEFTKSMDDEALNNNAWIKPAKFKELFDKLSPIDGKPQTEIDLTNYSLSQRDNDDISNDIKKAIDVTTLGRTINNIVKGNKWYDSAVAGVPNRQIFKNINITPTHLSQIISTDPKEANPVQLYQFAAQVSVEYSENDGAKVEPVSSAKVNISFTLASHGALLGFIKWASDTMPKYVYGAKDSSLRISNIDTSPIAKNVPVGGRGTEVPNLHWTNQLSSTYVNFEDNIQEYINNSIKDPLKQTLKEILSDPKAYGYEGDDYQIDSATIDIPDQGEDKDNQYANDFIFGSKISYSNLKRLNPTDSNYQALTNVYFGDYDDPDMNNAVIDDASKEYVDLVQDAWNYNKTAHPANLQDARLKFKDFMKAYGVDDINTEENSTLTIGDDGDEIQLDNIYSFGSIGYKGVAIKFSNFVGTFDLDMRLPWSFSFKEVDVDKDGKNPTPGKELNRSQDLAGLLEVLLTYRANMRYKFFVDISTQHIFSQRYLYYRDSKGKGDYANNASNDETVKRKDAYSTWNAIKRLDQYGYDGFNFGYNTFGHETREHKSLVGFAQTNAALNLSDDVANNFGYEDWVNNAGQYKFNFYNEAWHHEANTFSPMPYNRVFVNQNINDPASWAVKMDYTTSDFEWWVVPNDLAHFDSVWSQADLKKQMKIFKKTIIPNDYLFDPNALALVDTDYGTTK